MGKRVSDSGHRHARKRRGACPCPGTTLAFSSGAVRENSQRRSSYPLSLKARPGISCCNPYQAFSGSRVLSQLVKGTFPQSSRVLRKNPCISPQIRRCFARKLRANSLPSATRTGSASQVCIFEETPICLASSASNLQSPASFLSTFFPSPGQ